MHRRSAEVSDSCTTHVGTVTHLSPAEPVMVLSPHLDDALFSCGKFLADHPGAIVVTVFAGAPDVMHEGYNSRSTGQSYAPDALEVRRQEDRRVMSQLGATPIWLDLIEADYSAYRPTTNYGEQVVAEVSRVISEIGPASVIAPLGLVHPDHIAVSDACHIMWRKSSVNWYVYLDLPYGKAHPRTTKKRLKTLGRGAQLVALDGYRGDSELKVRLANQYESQFEATRENYHKVFDAAMTSDESYWRVDVAP